MCKQGKRCSRHVSNILEVGMSLFCFFLTYFSFWQFFFKPGAHRPQADACLVSYNCFCLQIPVCVCVRL